MLYYFQEVDTMLFQFYITLKEKDYLDFNLFHSFESRHGKKLVRKTLIIFDAFMVILMALVILLLGRTRFSITYVVVLGLLALIYTLLFKKVMTKNISTQIKRLKKIGKLPFEPTSTLEFYEDKVVEITPTARTEQNYSAFERVCIVADRYILIYRSSVGAYILPMAQIENQANMHAFMTFLAEKCSTVENY
jgi:hypothetical protein